MKTNSSLVRKSFLFLFAGTVGVLAIRQLPAAFNSELPNVHIEIDGVDYGRFAQIEGLENFDSNGLPESGEHSYSTIRVQRDFVSDPSLYLWAKNRRSKMNELKDVYLLSKNSDGTLITRQLLKACQPLSWTVEATTPSLGGFNETIDFAVQKISRM